jgi:hypothetical protein
MSSLSSISNAALLQFGGEGTYTVDSNNPFYSESLDRTSVSAITADTADNITYTLNGSPDLSKIIKGSLAVIVGDRNDTANNGIKIITNVVDSADQITVSNAGRTGTTVATAEDVFLSVKGLKAIAINVNSDLTVSTLELDENYGGSASISGFTAGFSSILPISELTVSAGEATLFLSSERKEPNQ